MGTYDSYAAIILLWLLAKLPKELWLLAKDFNYCSLRQRAIARSSGASGVFSRELRRVAQALCRQHDSAE